MRGKRRGSSGGDLAAGVPDVPAAESELLSAIVESSDDAIIGKDLSGRIISWNPAAERLYGYAAAEAVGRSISMLAPPDRRDEIPEMLGRVAAGERLRHVETVRRTKSGADVHVRLSLSPIRNQAGRVIGAATIARDITDQRRVERAVVEQAELLWAVVDSSPEGILSVDAEGVILFANPASERMFGYEVGELGGQPLEVLVPEGDRMAHARERAGYMKTRTIRRNSAHLRIRARRRDGTEFPADIGLAPLANLDGEMTLAMVRDMSEHERLTAEREGALTRFQALVEEIPAIVYTNSPDYSECLYVSPQFARMLGYDPALWIADSGFFDSLIHPDDRPAAFAAEETSIASGSPFEAQYRLIARDGREIWFHDRATLVHGPDGTPLFWQGVMLDVTERERARHDLERAQGELRRSELRLRAMTENISDVIVVIGADGRVRFSTPAMQSVLGYTPDAAVRAVEQVHPEDRGQATELFSRLLRNPGRVARAEVRTMHADGSWRWLEVTGKNMLDDPAVEGLLVTFRDISGRKEAEGKLRSSLNDVRALAEERDRLLSKLISAEERERQRIAIDIHDDTIQDVTALAMRLDIIARHHPELAADEQFEMAGRLARSAIRSLRHLTFQLHPYTLDREGIGPTLAAHLHELASLSETPRYEFQNLLSREPPIETRVVVYRIAHEALANSRRHSRASLVEVTLDERDGMYCVEVRDDGIGFEPRGGRSPFGHLGLTSMRDRAKAAGGWFSLESSPGAGTTVAAGIPPLAPPASEEAPEA